MLFNMFPDLARTVTICPCGGLGLVPGNTDMKVEKKGAPPGRVIRQRLAKHKPDDVDKNSLWHHVSAVFRIRMKNEFRSSGPSVHHLHRVTVSPFTSTSSPLIPCLFFAVALDSSQWWKCKTQTDASLLSRVTSESRISVSHLAFIGPQF